MLKNVSYLLLAVFIIIQFFHPAKNINETAGAMSNDISNIFSVPANIQIILQTSCYDCHSNNTKYPWYNNIQPVAWWLRNHINEGKREINFNEFASYSLRRQYKKFDEIIEQLKEDEMPLSSYTIIHKNALLTKEQKKLLSGWASAAMDSMSAKYPIDSLQKKKEGF